ncbi:MAG TPA: glycosyltransferase family 39 protein [Candidatus Paceibacterota bacterium]|nr:glycosyltransferase family 39 protein [Candidatus Paceibacterota bacterium]
MNFLQKISSRTATWVLVLICIASLSLMTWAMLTDSTIVDEVAHIPAGYGYVHNLSYDLNPEHPPLVKALAALPLLLIHPHFPTNDPAWTTNVNDQWTMGGKFLYGWSANNATEIVRVARIVPMLLTIFLIIFIYIWSRELMGPLWALVPAFLFGLSPTILSHGHYVTTDVGAAIGILVPTYFFLKFLYRPSKKSILFAGLAFGVGELTKFSTALLAPYFAIAIVIYYLVKSIARRQGITTNVFVHYAKALLRAVRDVVIVFAIGYLLVVYPVYALFTANYPIAKQVSDTTTIMATFGNGPTAAGHLCSGMRCFADLDIWMAGHQITRPFGEYLLGVLMTMQRAAAGNTGYFLGSVSNVGSPLYFPVAYLLKEPLPSLLMVIVALWLTLAAFAKKAKNGWQAIKSHVMHYLNSSFTQFSMALFVVIYWAYSIHSPLNIGVRHLMPTIPLIYILTAGVWKRWITTVNIGPVNSAFDAMKAGAKHLMTASVKYLILVLLLVWFFGETLFAAPYFLSYFNEIGGGVWNGYRSITDSNYDWGQDFLRFQQFVNAHPEINSTNKIAVDYFGGANAHYYLGDKEVDWWSAKGNPADQGIHWLAVSINTLEGETQPITPGSTFTRQPQDEYSWLMKLRPPPPGAGQVPTPDYRIGTTIFVYKL